MQNPSSARQDIQRLRERADQNVLLDEAMIAILVQEVSAWPGLSPEHSAQVQDAIRHHRVGIIKQKAFLGCLTAASR